MRLRLVSISVAAPNLDFQNIQTSVRTISDRNYTYHIAGFISSYNNSVICTATKNVHHLLHLVGNVLCSPATLGYGRIFCITQYNTNKS